MLVDIYNNVVEWSLGITEDYLERAREQLYLRLDKLKDNMVELKSRDIGTIFVYHHNCAGLTELIGIGDVISRLISDSSQRHFDVNALIPALRIFFYTQRGYYRDRATELNRRGSEEGIFFNYDLSDQLVDDTISQVNINVMLGVSYLKDMLIYDYASSGIPASNTLPATLALTIDKTDNDGFYTVTCLFIPSTTKSVMVINSWTIRTNRQVMARTQRNLRATISRIHDVDLGKVNQHVT